MTGTYFLRILTHSGAILPGAKITRLQKQTAVFRAACHTQAKHINILLSKRGSQKCFARQCTAPNNGSKSDKTEKKDKKEPFTCQTNNSGIKRNKKMRKVLSG